MPATTTWKVLLDKGEELQDLKFGPWNKIAGSSPEHTYALLAITALFQLASAFLSRVE